MTAAIPPPLDDRTFAHALKTLAARDDDPAQAVARFGPPPMWRRRPCFATLVRIVPEKQTAEADLAAIAAAWQPWRAVAARILWHYYLSIRGKRAPGDFLKAISANEKYS